MNVPLCQSWTPEGRSDCWGHMLDLCAQAMCCYARRMSLVFGLFQLLQKKEAGTALSPARLGFSTGLPASLALVKQTSVFSALSPSCDEHTMVNVTTSSSISLHCSFWKLVLFARQHLVSSSVVPWTGICGHLSYDDWIWEEDQTEKQVVCQNDRMSVLDIQTSCLMHFEFKLHRIILFTKEKPWPMTQAFLTEWASQST